MSESTPMGALVERIVEGRAPFSMRSAAARGALPLPRTVLVRLYVILLEDADGEIRSFAEASLRGLTPESIREVLDDPECSPEVLLHYAKPAAHEEALAEKVAFHPRVPSSALAVLASSGVSAVVELVLTNQERLLKHPELLEQLMVNPVLRSDQQGRILELLDRAARQKPQAGEAGPESGPEADSEADPQDLEEAARLLDVDVGELLSASEILGAEELEQSDDAAVRSAFRKILTLTAAQKALLALKGGREERQILIRDTNRVVAMGVLRNPRLTELEVDSIARMRNVTDEVLRHVGANREWTRNYGVIHSLVLNPKCPQAVAANFIPRLTSRDLKSLASNRDVPELIRRNAKRTHDLRTQKVGKSFRKKK